MKLKIVLLVLILALAIGLVAKTEFQVKKEVAKVVTDKALIAGDHADSLNLSVEKLKIKDAKEDWCLCGVDQNGYYFTSSEVDGQIEFYYYDITLETSKRMVFEVGNGIYNTYFRDQKMFLITKNDDAGDSVTIIEVDMQTDTIETIYKDDGKHYPEYFFYENNLVMANAYDNGEDAFETFKIIKINLEDHSTETLKLFNDESVPFENQDKILKMGGRDDFLYVEFVKNLKVDGIDAYYLSSYDLKTGKVVTLELDEAMDFIAGDEHLFVSRTYATGEPLTNNAVSFNLYNSKLHVYQKRKIYATDSTNQPYELRKIKGYYVLLLSQDIILVDAKELTFDSLNYRSKNSSECISPPFIINNKIHYMKEILNDENYNRVLYTCEIN